MYATTKSLAFLFLASSVFSTAACAAPQEEGEEETTPNVDLSGIDNGGSVEIKSVTSAPTSSPSAEIHPSTGKRYRFMGAGSGSPIKYWIDNGVTRTMSTDVTAPGSVTVASNESDKLFVFVADQSEAIRFRTINSSGTFGPWQFMGHYAKITPTATMVAPNVMAAFMVGNDGHVYYRLINTIYGTLGTTGMIPSLTTKRPLGAAMLNGITYLFLVEDGGSNRIDIAQLVYNYSAQTLNFTGPGSWLDYGIDGQDVSAHRISGTSTISVAAVDTNSYLRYRVIFSSSNLGSWSYDPAWALVAGQPALCGPDVYVRGLDGNVYEKVFASTGSFVAPYN